jgi:dephospho-CoA kinase|tara:strand:- start:4352 stop:4984 length:633 start_codon:yes stop_codon:yes gene_type:complete
MQKKFVKDPIKIAITGKIGTGKSTISNIIKRLDYLVFDCDDEVDVLYSDLQVKNRIVELFKNKIVKLLNKDKTINRTNLSNFVFSKKSELKKLEKIIHPLVEKRRKEFIKKECDRDLLFFDVPLLFEKKLSQQFDFIIYLYVNKKIQLERVLKRSGMTKKKFNEIYKSQRHNLKMNEKFISLKLNTEKSISDLKEKIQSFIIEIKKNKIT